MGMDLKPVRPTKLAPRYPNDDKYSPGKPIWGRYNWSGWSWICERLEAWGVTTEHFAGANDGDLIPAAKCREVADAIEKHLPELSEENRQWLKPHIQLWRTCGGYKQY